MTDHEHTWAPAEGVTARYRCDCGAWGIRAGAGSAFRRMGGPIVEMKAPPCAAVGPAITAQPSTLGVPAIDPGTGRAGMDVLWSAALAVGCSRTRRAPRSR